ncbi:cytochrome-c peroxidase [Hymenobacter sediminis]|uniref:cytochrome-c peroxidase n=1 Tax=Hymenobacter sediminis TaxID=2218621 RepID=UPI0013905A13|nr:cytochrome c peroxidase [Hymenobacter sediminis]
MVLLVVGLAGLLTIACRPTTQPPEAVPGNALPGNFPTPWYALNQNPPNQAAFELGKQLFYEVKLSRDGSVSCGSCHRQEAAFAQANQSFSRGVNNRLGVRNAPALQNLRWRHSLLWDGGVSNLEMLPLAPLTNPVEMDESLDNVLVKLNADATYSQRFAAVYGAGPITSQQFLRALAQFTASLTSANSRYDHYVHGERGGTLSIQEVRGLQLFRKSCAGCHATDLFTDESFRNNGLDASFASDSGRAHITDTPRDRGKFKVPSLRNVAHTAPYMHDGRFATLGQVLAHYDHGVVASATLDPQLRQADGRLGIPLTAKQQKDLEAFLRTLTDTSFLSDPRLAKPQ